MQIDWLMGEVLAALDERGLSENTLVLFTSDNGPILFDDHFDGAAEANGEHHPAGGWRGWKYLRTEGGTRVPLIAHWPGRMLPGVSAELVSLLDFFPSLAALLTQPYPQDAGKDGQNLLPALLGGTNPHPRTSLVLHGLGNVLALRSGDWKFIPANNDAATGNARGADPRDQRFADGIVPEVLLFNLADDPGETINLAHKYPKRLKELRCQLEEITKTPR